MPVKPKTDQERYPEDYFINPSGHVRDRIIIHESMEIPKEGLFLSLNGYSFLAKSGVEIDLPRPVRLMLDTRIKTESIQDNAGNIHTRNIPRFTYTLIKEDINVSLPDPEVIDAVAKDATDRQVSPS